MSVSLRGVLLALFANVCFGVLYMFSSWMQPLTGTEVYIWRAPTMLLAVLILMRLIHAQHSVRLFVDQMGRNKTKWCLFLLTTPILAIQHWLFMWAPVNGHAVNVAMGYFLFPLMMVLIGLLSGETLNRWQKAALLFALLGVINELWQTQAFAWTTIVVFLLNPPYFIIRKRLAVPVLVGLLFDLVLVLPFALWLLFTGDTPAIVLSTPKLWLLIPLLGILSTLSMFALLQASWLIPVTLFGMLAYIEPVLLFVVSIGYFHTSVPLTSWLSYGLIWLGLLCMFSDSLRQYLYQRQQALQQPQASE